MRRYNYLKLLLIILILIFMTGCGASISTIPSTYTVTFDSQGGSAINSQVVPDGGLVTEPTAPTRTGYNFGGWYKESGCTNDWVFNTDTVTSNITLYAKWTAPATYSLRDIGPAGGWIFYDKGFVSNGWRYLEAAPKSTEWTEKEWGSYETLIGATTTGIGTGRNNTTKIVTWLNDHSETDCAAQLCDALVYGGYNDWFLSSQDELTLMYQNLHNIATPVGGFTGSVVTGYWSSSELDADYAWFQVFHNGNQYYDFKGRTILVRAVRAF